MNVPKSEEETVADQPNASAGGEKRIEVLPVQPARSILKSPKGDVSQFQGSVSMKRTISWQDVHGRGDLTVIHHFEPRCVGRGRRIRWTR